MRPSGAWTVICFTRSLSIRPAAFTPSVSITPGLMPFTRMLRGPSSLDLAFATAFDGGLARAVDDAVGRRDGARDRADVNDAAAGLHVLARFFRSENETEHVQVELLVKVLF